MGDTRQIRIKLICLAYLKDGCLATLLTVIAVAVILFLLFAVDLLLLLALLLDR